MNYEEFEARMKAALYEALTVSPKLLTPAQVVEADRRFGRLLAGTHEWRGPTHDGPTTLPPDTTTPRENHVRAAVEANR
jgi:hypothetical protein